jgi:hypothetical protein
MKPCAPVGPQPMDFDPWGKPGSTSPPLVPPKDREGAPHDSSSHHRAYRPRTTAVSLSVERAMIGVMPSRTWESQLGWLVTDLRLWPSARSRPFNAPGPARIRAAAEYVLPTTRQRAFPTAPWDVHSRLAQPSQCAEYSENRVFRHRTGGRRSYIRRWFNGLWRKFVTWRNNGIFVPNNEFSTL